MSDTLTTALDTVSTPKERKPVNELLARLRPELIKSLQRDDAVEVLTRHYLNALRLNPLLMECKPESIAAGVFLSAQVRLEPGPLGHVYLVPYKGECVWMLGYTGILELARRSERVGALKATVVWDCDSYVAPWENERGLHYELKPGPEDERGDRVGVLVTWKERIGGSWVANALHTPRARIERARKASPAARAGHGLWLTDETAAWAKTGVRHARPWLPLSPDAGYAMQHDEAVVTGIDADAGGEAYPVIEAAPAGEGDTDAATEHTAGGGDD